MEQYLIDNNAVSNYFAGLFSQKGMDFMASVLDQTPRISVITEIEALSWVHSDKSKEDIVKAFVQDATIINLTPSIVSECIRIRRSRKIKTPDAILAATAITYNLVLITSDNGFKRVESLRIIDPFSL